MDNPQQVLHNLPPSQDHPDPVERSVGGPQLLQEQAVPPTPQDRLTQIEDIQDTPLPQLVDPVPQSLQPRVAQAPAMEPGTAVSAPSVAHCRH